MPDILFLAFWNVENLFDVEAADRPEKLRRIIAKDIAGWNQPLLDSKLRQLSTVIRSMNSGAGPDILGVCEVENRNVLVKLTERIANDGGRKYLVAHADTSDNRGIDVQPKPTSFWGRGRFGKIAPCGRNQYKAMLQSGL